MLPGKNRLPRREIRITLQTGHTARTKQFTVSFKKNPFGFSRWAIRVGQKQSRLATRRNRIERLIAEAIRLSPVLLDTTFDVVVRPGTLVLDKPPETIVTELIRALQTQRGK